MTLKDWLESIEKTGTWLADALGISHQAVYAWLNGRALPSNVHLIEIERLSEGRVTGLTLRKREETTDA